MKTPASLSPLRLVAQVTGLLLLASSFFGCSPKPPAHGTSFTLSFNQTTSQLVTADLRAATENALRARLKRLGVNAYLEPSVDPGFRISVPPLSTDELAAVRATLTKPGFLAFRLVHSENDELVSHGDNVSGYRLLKRKELRPDGNETIEALLVKESDEPGLSGIIVQRASCTSTPVGGSEITFELTPDAAVAFARLTRENINRRLAIMVDDELYSAPRIMGEIPSGRGMITGQFTVPEANVLATLMSSPLPAQVRVVEEKTY